MSQVTQESDVYRKVKSLLYQGKFTSAEAACIRHWAHTAWNNPEAQLCYAMLNAFKGHLEAFQIHFGRAQTLGVAQHPVLQADWKALSSFSERSPGYFCAPAMTEFEGSVFSVAVDTYSRPLKILDWGNGKSAPYFFPTMPAGSTWDTITESMELAEASEKLLKKAGLEEKIQIHPIEDDANRDGWWSKENPKDYQNYIGYPASLSVHFDVILIDGKVKRQCLEEGWKLLSQEGMLVLRNAETIDGERFRPQGSAILDFQNKAEPSSPHLKIYFNELAILNEFLIRLKKNLLPYMAFEMETEALAPNSVKNRETAKSQQVSVVQTQSQALQMTLLEKEIPALGENSGVNSEATSVTDRVFKLLTRSSPVALHIGCGTVYLPGWINIDNNSDQNITRLDLLWDFAQPLPFPDASVDFVFHEHFLEHLSVQEAQKFLLDMRRVLKPRGVMRVAMPDLADVINNYLDPKWRSLAFLQKYGMQTIKTRAELINISFRSWGHQHLYDAEELERRIREAGFNRVKPCRLRESEHIVLRGLETREESTLIAEAGLS